MIENIEHQYLTEEERQKLADLEQRLIDLNMIMHHPYKDENSPAYGAVEFLEYDPEAGLHEADKEKVSQLAKLENEYFKTFAEARNKYIKERKPAGLIEDIHIILDSITKSDYEDYLKSKRQSYEFLKSLSDGTEPFNSLLADLAPDKLARPETCFDFVFDKISLQAGELRNDETIQGEIRNLVIKKVESLLSKADPEEAYMIMARSKVTSEYSRMNYKQAEEDRIANKAIINRHDVKLEIQLDNMRGKLGVSTSKLLSYSLSVLTRQNDFRTADPKKLNKEIHIPLREYAEALGYDVAEHITFTAEDEEKERKRVKTIIDNVRKSVRKDLSIIHASTLSWEEKIRNKTAPFNLSLIDFSTILNGNIVIVFTDTFSKYLSVSNKMTYYPKVLLKLDANHQQTAYYIGHKIADYHAMDGNRLDDKSNKSNILSVKTLLDASNLISYEELQKTPDKGHWYARIKDPFENALDTLKAEGLLKGWKYTHGKSIDLTDDEAYNIDSYKKFASMYITFEMAEEPDDAERLQKKQEARKKNTQKNKPRKKKETGK